VPAGFEHHSTGDIFWDFRPSRRTALSLRSRVRSSAIEVTVVAAGIPVSVASSAFRTQSRVSVRFTPRLAATRATPIPFFRTIRTASALNAGGYIFLIPDTKCRY
jgi:hypothetical protein